MLYSRSDKVSPYLANYNISSVSYSRTGWNAKFGVTNLNTGKDYKLEIENPLYNVLSPTNTSFFEFKTPTVDSALLQKITFGSDVEADW